MSEKQWRNTLATEAEPGVRLPASRRVGGIMGAPPSFGVKMPSVFLYDAAQRIAPVGLVELVECLCFPAMFTEDDSHGFELEKTENCAQGFGCSDDVAPL
ncbi:hypothetical protein Hypma_002363 [Hypsizygus marmoreus]|uniref:Uncharacterized protein n=1 Tax=Hypsizygus marmoreus TaxID=39966 RepID=A0A369JB26_HYPMA|nr:hypothetical protein Hypma_002363 [Hypsizygus marmoreus]